MRAHECYIDVIAYSILQPSPSQRISAPAKAQPMTDASTSSEVQWPCVASLALLAKFSFTPEEDDWFYTKGGTRGSPSCVEYSDKAPDGDRYGALDGGLWLQAKEVAVVLIPAWRHKPAEWGIAIRCDSTLVIGGDAWVNVSRGRSTFAWHSKRLPAG